MSERRQELLDELARYYESCGWRVERGADGTVRAAGTGGVTWIGLAVIPDDLQAEGFADRLVELSEERMPAGERCPFELLPDEHCADELRDVLAGLRLSERVSVYSLAA